jgi:predicted N-acetyltransferase YhbS
MAVEALDAFGEADFAEILAGEADPFTGGDSSVRWRPLDLHMVLRAPGGRLIGHVGLGVAELDAAGEPLRAVGVGGVLVSRAHRGQGVLRPLLEAALRRAETLGPDVALLFCDPRRSPMYASFGFRDLAWPVTVDQAGGPHVMAEAAMWRPLRTGARWPDGPVRLRGLPF